MEISCRRDWHIKTIFEEKNMMLLFKFKTWVRKQMLIARTKKLDIRKNVRIYYRTGGVNFGENICIMDNNVIYADAPTSNLHIGDGTYIGEFNNIRCTGSIHIGNNCLISQYVSLISVNHNYMDKNVLIKDQGENGKNGIFIGDDVWIGNHVTILPGVTVGDGVVIGAGTIVNKDVPAYAVIVGNPAKILKYRK